MIPCTDLLQGQALSGLLSLPDPEAAPALAARLSAWDEMDRLVHSVSFVERGQIVVAFERRLLWRHLDDSRTGEKFASFAAWMGQSSLGCRSVNYESLRDIRELADIPPAKLFGIPKTKIKMLKGLSGSVRQDDDVLEAARTLSDNEFIEKIATEYPSQHLEARRVLRFRPETSAIEKIEEALQQAIDDGAPNRDAALEYLAIEYLNGRQSLDEVKV